MKRINVYFPTDLLAQLEAEASRRDVPLADVIRQACEHLMDSHSVLGGAASRRGVKNRWWSLQEVTGGGFFLRDSQSNVITQNGDALGPVLYLTRHNSGSAGTRQCAHCGEEFEATMGTLFGSTVTEIVFICPRSEVVLRSRR